MGAGDLSLPSIRIAWQTQELATPETEAKANLLSLHTVSALICQAAYSSFSHGAHTQAHIWGAITRCHGGEKWRIKVSREQRGIFMWMHAIMKPNLQHIGGTFLPFKEFIEDLFANPLKCLFSNRGMSNKRNIPRRNVKAALISQNCCLGCLLIFYTSIYW